MRKRTPIISVVIPFYRKLDLLFQAIDSVYQQNYDLSKIEIVVSDEENLIDNKKIIKSKYPQVIYTHNIYKKGPGGNRTSALNKAKGEYIIFLDSDDKIKSHFISIMIKYLQDKKSLGAVSLSEVFFGEGFLLKNKIKMSFFIFLRNLFLVSEYFLNNGNLFKNSFYICQISHMMFKAKAVAGFKFNYDYNHGGEEWDMFIKVLQKGNIRIVTKRLTIFRYSPSSNTMSAENQMLKWKSYSLLVSRLRNDFRKGVFYQLFLFYINMFKGR